VKNSTRVVPRVDENLLDFLSYYELISKSFYSMTEVLYPTIKDINAWRTVVTIIEVAKTKLSHTNNRARNARGTSFSHDMLQVNSLNCKAGSVLVMADDSISLNLMPCNCEKHLGTVPSKTNVFSRNDYCRILDITYNNIETLKLREQSLFLIMI